MDPKFKLKMLSIAPYYGAIDSVMKWDSSLALTTTVPAISTSDGRYWVDLTQPEEVIPGLIAHEYGHILLSHMLRCEAQGLDHSRYNIAGDLVINQIVEATGFKIPDGGMTLINNPTGSWLAGGKSEEQYYDMLPDTEPPQNICKHSKGEDEPSPERVAQMKEAVAQSVTELLKHEHAKKLPPSLRERLQEIIGRSKVNWSRIIKNRIASDIQCHKGVPVQRYGRINRRQAFYGSVIRKSEVRLKSMVLIGVDTSGSMSGDRLEEACKAVCSATRMADVRAFSVTDNINTEAVQIKSAKDILGLTEHSGGTDMRKAFDKAIEMKRDLILITDGETQWPKADQLPRRHLVIVINDKIGMIPSHIKYIQIKEGE